MSYIHLMVSQVAFVQQQNWLYNLDEIYTVSIYWLFPFCLAIYRLSLLSIQVTPVPRPFR